jgi:hypothetical protein
MAEVVTPGNTGEGALSLPGLKAGNAILRIIPEGFETGFEAVVTVDDQFQQLSSFDWSTVSLTLYLLRGV